MSLELKIKQVSLADEARYIRKMENKVKGFQRNAKKAAEVANSEDTINKYRRFAAEHGWKAITLRLHRKGIVASEARNANIARAFLKGKPYAFAESEGFHSCPDILRIATLTLKYRPNMRLSGTSYYSKKDLIDQITVIANWIAEHPKLTNEQKAQVNWIAKLSAGSVSSK